MKITNLLKHVTKLPEIVREVIYLIYLIFYFLKSMKVFFNPHKERFVTPEQTTAIPRETENGIVHEYMTDDEIREKHAHDNAMELDPAYLVSKGVEPRTFSGAVMSPLDAHDRIVNSADEAVGFFKSQQPAQSSAPKSTATNENNSEN